VIDVASNQVIVRGLFMPHFPGWYKDKLWSWNSCTDNLCYIDRECFEPIIFFSGYIQKIMFSENYVQWSVLFLSVKLLFSIIYRY